ncbi:MAG: TIGR03435 family protein [Acidobacteria bacterium]|nr:TIGR03435 family protein [Acidobacteriota bacterium]
MLRVFSAALLCASMARGQPPDRRLTFEVASVRPAAPQAMARLQGSVDGGPGTSNPGRIRFTDMPLRALIMRAYDVQSFQVLGPSWMDSERFDVIAKVPGGASREDARVMLQNLLADRFRLKLHKETKEAPVYEMTVAKVGIRMKEAAPAEAAGDHPPGPPPTGEARFRMPRGQLGIQATVNGRMSMRGDGVTMADLAGTLGLPLGRPVVDKTGLTGTYDIQVEFSPEGIGLGPKGPTPSEAGGGNPAEVPRDSGPTLFTALQSQLGLKLTSRKGPVDRLVVERVEKMPTGN